ncbi:hypothetical protein K503DRAFT_322054 [Rhizopogon vinicolor AM-OR11-026]|uniref:Uncharacterized protein n=1 Tax=Rhizopogon vinicolor AM-OR11-026 TaxID=1314800 RepID=A0A1B7MUA4_9AGAM|nr:hypothetical protein K503DRAFT_322054 [Rhizopogon vinicolor AM-OR11-026]
MDKKSSHNLNDEFVRSRRSFERSRRSEPPRSHHRVLDNWTREYRPAPSGRPRTHGGPRAPTGRPSGIHISSPRGTHSPDVNVIAEATRELNLTSPALAVSRPGSPVLVDAAKHLSAVSA